MHSLILTRQGVACSTGNANTRLAANGGTGFFLQSKLCEKTKRHGPLSSGTIVNSLSLCKTEEKKRDSIDSYLVIVKYTDFFDILVVKSWLRSKGHKSYFPGGGAGEGQFLLEVSLSKRKR